MRVRVRVCMHLRLRLTLSSEARGVLRREASALFARRNGVFSRLDTIERASFVDPRP